MAHRQLLAALVYSGRFAQALAALDEARLHLDPGFVAALAPLLGSLSESESKLARILREKGAEDPSVSATVGEISGKIPSDAFPANPVAIQAFWENHHDEVAVPLGSATVRTLTMPKSTGRQSAEKIHADLLAGADFAEKAREHSIDSFSEDGGLRGEITQGSDALRKDLIDVAFSLKAGEIRLVDDQGSCSITEVDSSQPGTLAAAEQLWKQGDHDGAWLAIDELE